MAKITVKPLSKNDPIFTKSFMTFSKLTNKRRNNENNNSKYRSISALKHHVGVLGKKIAEESVQLHGGMGVSEEMSIGHYLKRFISIDSQFGNSHFHLKKFNNS